MAKTTKIHMMAAIGGLSLAAAGCSGGAAWGTGSSFQGGPVDSGAPPADAAAALPPEEAGPTGPQILVDASGVSSADAGPPDMTSLQVVIRDFKFWDASDPTTNPDFQNVLGDDHGTPTSGNMVVGTIVAEALGADHKPVYKSATQTRTTHGKADFDQWYNDVPGTNITVTIPLALTRNADGTYGYDSLVSGVPLSATDPTKMWFPIDDGSPYETAFGDQGQAHNYSFTTELHTIFTYNGGETFTFSGDDDVFVFIDGKLVIDLGGVHQREQATVDLDTLGLTMGSQYPLDLFNAERHTVESNMSFTTTLQLQPVAQ